MSNMDSPTRQAALRERIEAAYPAVEPPDGLRARIADMARAADEHSIRRRVWGRRLKWSLGLAAVTTVAVLAMIVVPRIAEALVLRRIAAATASARSLHAVQYRVDAGGVRTKSGESWAEGGMRRVDGPAGRIGLYVDGVEWEYLRDPDVVRWRRHLVPPARYAQLDRQDLSPAGSVTRLEQAGLPVSARIEGDVVVDGRKARKVLVDILGGRCREIMYVDPATDLPFRTDHQRAVRDRYVTELLGETEYNVPMPPGTFVPVFPKTASVVGVEEGQRRLRDRLIKGVAARAVGDRTIMIRDFQVNAEGDVFILFTARRRADRPPSGDMWCIEGLSDDVGSRYVTGRAQCVPAAKDATMVWTDPYTFDGELLQFGMFVRSYPADRWKPRRYTITFGLRNLDPRTDARHSEALDPSEHTTIELLADRIGCDVTPAYMPYMLMPMGDLTFRISRADARAEELDRGRRDLPRAVAEYRNVIALTQQRDGTENRDWLVAYSWFRLYDLLRGMKQTDQARAALAHARKADDGLDSYLRQQISDAVKREGLK